MSILTAGEVLLQGQGLSSGIGIGTLFFLPTEGDCLWGEPEISSHPEIELERFQFALEDVAKDIKQLQKNSERSSVQESVMLLGSQLQLLFDPILVANIEQEITLHQATAESALRKVVADYQKKFLAIGDLFFTERFQDVRDITERLMASLRGVANKAFSQMPLHAIVVTMELSASNAIEAVQQGAIAFITARGTINSHAVIIAKGKGLPFVSQVEIASILPFKEVKAIVNGANGEVVINPLPASLRRYFALSGKIQRHFNRLAQKTSWPAETYDGYLVELTANIDILNEVAVAKRYGSDGIGLFRTEYLLLAEMDYPTEAEQYAVYKEAAELVGPKSSIVIRSFDIGGDKLPRCYRGKEERNALLGCRAIRFLLQEKELFKTQLRAIIRANVHGNISLLFPMVSTVGELLKAKEYVREAEEEVKNSGVILKNSIKIGCMIEVPSAALIVDLLAKECDFISIGTNDLIQYSLAVDRENFIVRDLYSAANPSILRLIKFIANEALHQGIPVTVCGEMAADPRFTPILLGLGVHQLSVAPWHLPAIKRTIRHTAIVAASQLTEYVMGLSCTAEIEAVLDAEHKRILLATSS